MKGTLRLAFAALCLFAIPALACASDTAPKITITSPREGLTVASRLVIVQASYVASGEAVIELVELAVDGITVDARKLDPAKAKGTVSFEWLAHKWVDGKHRVCVRAVDSSGEVGKKEISVWLRGPGSAPAGGVRITSPGEGDTVSGRTPIQVEVDDPALARYVIFLVDDVFKAMSNVRPFTYLWDTTRYLNGAHNLKAKAYSGGDWEAASPAVRVTVDNPSGATAMLPAQLTTSPASAAPMAPPARAGEPTLPPPMRTESPTPAPPPASSRFQVAVPGTVPFISPSGELIRPPTPPAADTVEEAAGIEVAALPADAAAAPMPASTVAAAPDGMTAQPAVDEPAPALAPALMALAAAGPAVAPASVAREPAQAGIEIALLPAVEPESASAVSPAPAPDIASISPSPSAETSASSPQAPAPEPLEIALPPVPAPAPVVTLPAERSPDLAPMASAQPHQGQLIEAGQPIVSGIAVAMLPPRPVEIRPAPRLAAEPAVTRVAYLVQPGDWLSRIASELGLSAREIARANNLSDPGLLHAGQMLSIPSTPVYFDDRPVACEAPTVISEGKAIVPFRAMMEQAGGQVNWDAAARRASAVARGHEIAVRIGSDEAEVDGGKVAMGAAAALRCNRTVVPLRFLGDALDLALQYEDGIIHIASAR